MPTLRKLLLLLLAAVAVAALARRRQTRPEKKVDLYHEDGTLVTVEERSPEGARLFSLARELRRTVAS
jgi:hypothetical protein